MRLGWVTRDIDLIEFQPSILNFFFSGKALRHVYFNVKKCSFMVFKSHKKQLKTNLTIKLSNQIIQTVDKTKFLGIVIDQHLTWKSHIEFIASKIPSAIGIRCRILFFIYQPLLKMLYNSLIYLYLCYGNVVWANNYSTRLFFFFFFLIFFN